VDDLSIWYLERYLEGQHGQVWTELYGIGARVREDEQTWADAVAVAQETMARVRRNIERLREELPRIGYRFSRPQRVLVPPPPDVTEQIDRTEATIGAVPLAFRVFWESIGSVDLSGEHPDWPSGRLDPLMFEASADYYVDTYRDMIEQRVLTPGEPFELDFAPDDLHKADISGGPPYAIRVPNAGVDGIVVWEVHQTTFVNYLRTAMRFGGLAGLSPAERHGYAALPVPADVRAVVTRLEPF